MATPTQLIVSGILGLGLYQWYSFSTIRSKVDHIPTIGSDNFLWSYLSAWRHVFNGRAVIKEGYIKHPGSAFKFPTFTTKTGWMIMVNGETLVEELRKAPDDVLSFPHSVVDTLQTVALLGEHHAGIPEYHANVIRGPMTRALSPRFADIHDEIVEACTEYLPASDDWQPLKFHEACIHIICRTSNRLYVGLPLCRDPEYRTIQENWTIKFVMGTYLTHLTPVWAKSIGGYLMQNLLSSTKTVEDYLRPVILERLENDEKFGPNWAGKPNDAISWLLDLAPLSHRTVNDVTTRIMLINFASIHTTSPTVTYALFDIAARPEYIKPLREEMEEVIRTHGWTKEAMGYMRKLDSFIKESSRRGGVISTSVARKALKDFTFSNGVTIPAGYTVSASADAIHSDPAIYEDADNFNGFRFVDMADKGSNDSTDILTRNQMVSLDSRYLLFGLGRHTCPGRFFAVNEVKAILTHILLNYDVKLPGTEIPPSKSFGGNTSPDPAAQLLFRKRKAD